MQHSIIIGAMWGKTYYSRAQMERECKLIKIKQLTNISAETLDKIFKNTSNETIETILRDILRGYNNEGYRRIKETIRNI